MLVVLLLALFPLASSHSYTQRSRPCGDGRSRPFFTERSLFKGLPGAPFGGFGACAAGNLLGEDVRIGELADS